jgi:hypothetical protein
MVATIILFVVSANNENYKNWSSENSDFVKDGVLDVARCKAGRDSIYFGFGSSHFRIKGIVYNKCVFVYGTEIENPRWDGELNTYCEVPINSKITYNENIRGIIKFNGLDEYCRTNED